MKLIDYPDILQNQKKSKKGWPWIFENKEEQNADDFNFPKISIVTPSYNQAEFLEETILSVINQGYPNLEFLILDGGSTDGSKEIIEKYAAHLTFWKSEPDEGQSAAIREGFERATGDVFGWLNSDDVLLPDALFKIGRYFALHLESQCVIGGSIVIDENGEIVLDRMRLPRVLRGGKRTFKHLLLVECGFFQPASFWRREAYLSVGGLDPKFVFTMDYDLYLKFAQKQPLDHLDELLACFRFHADSKTSRLAAVQQKESEELWGFYKRSKYSLVHQKAYKFFRLLVTRAYNLPIRMGIRVKTIKNPYGLD